MFIAPPLRDQGRMGRKSRFRRELALSLNPILSPPRPSPAARIIGTRMREGQEAMTTVDEARAALLADARPSILSSGAAADVTAQTFAGTLPAIQRTDDHRYRSFEMEPGTFVPGCTTVVGPAEDKVWLQRWYAKMAAEAALELYKARKMKGATVDQIASAGGAKRDAAATQGSQIHAYAETYVKGERLPDWIEPENMARLDAFKRWWDGSGWKLRLSEAPIIKPPSEQSPYGWGGTIDLLCYDKEGRTVLADIKTGSNVGREAVLQLTGYGMASRIAPSLNDQRAYPMPQVQRYVILHVTNTGVKPIDVIVGQNERSAFYSCLDIYYWTKSAGAKISA